MNQSFLSFADDLEVGPWGDIVNSSGTHHTRFQYRVRALGRYKRMLLLISTGSCIADNP